jgi:hypothetical protein
MSTRSAQIEAGLWRWTGPLRFDLRSESGQSGGRCEFVVHLDTVEVYGFKLLEVCRLDMINTHTRRLAGTINRDELRRWIRHRRDVLEFNDVILGVRVDHVAVRLNCSDPYPVPAVVVDQLVGQL